MQNRATLPKKTNPAHYFYQKPFEKPTAVLQPEVSFQAKTSDGFSDFAFCACCFFVKMFAGKMIILQRKIQ
jgi:hypothetical protein